MSRKKTSHGSKDAQGKQTNKTTQKNSAAGKPAAVGSQQIKNLSEFHYPKRKPNDNTILHPVYVFKKVGRRWVFFEITHDKNNSNRSKTKTLEKNPNPKDARTAKIKKKADEKDSEYFSPRLKGWKFWTKKDKDTVNELIKKYNQTVQKSKKQ